MIEGIDLALFFNKDPNLTYFSQARPEYACLAMPANGKPVLFVPGFEADRMAQQAKVEVVKTDKNVLEKVKALFPARKIGIISNQLTYANAQKIQNLWSADLIDISGQCTSMRLVKNKEEIEKITKACAITDHILQELMAKLQQCKTELDAATFLKTKMSNYGFEPSFPPIIATAGNAATPHHIPTHTKLNGFTVIDFGLIYKNYCSDITRTVFIGTPNEKQRKLYENVLRVQEEGIEKCKTGITLEEIDKKAHEKLGKEFIHKIGHSLGIEVHDVQPSPFEFAPNAITTIEPGVYSPGKYGIRIEDDVLVTKKEPIVLTKMTKELVAIRHII